MEVSAIILRATDVEMSTQFWSERVGLAVEGQMPGFTFLGAGPVTIVLSAIEEVDDQSLTEIVLRSEDVRVEFEGMSARRVPFESELTVIMSQGGKDLISASFRDPDGHYGAIQGWV